MATKLDGSALAKKVKAEVKEQVAALKELGKETQLAVVLVGEEPASQIYVNFKHKDAKEVNIVSKNIRLPEETSQEELDRLIDSLNEDEEIDGILVQLPLPKHLDEEKITQRIDPSKDVDAFHPYNVGLLARNLVGMPPCTPAGIMRFFEEYDIDLRGKHVVVVGRSNIVGRPIALMLLNADATVTVCHSKTKNVSAFTKEADILISAIGKANFFGAEDVKEGAVVVDVGMNTDEAGKLVGDIDYAAVEPKASFITPVPGGVGPMTRAQLMLNTVYASKLHYERQNAKA
ncbi:MAG: bifunctional methylenetetrahydrofolate dehydrogenase/methenyltetrahydrofolate cyclohydrolase FolD [Coriobacteriia bacterium]|nr:bifunctional methylenetetrahydrofolate dehydrogenase/methenyltetrahydrofolate cyclohydrolase FolD [Coriobacteriia bacterium]